jgi:hypothetical protein
MSQVRRGDNLLQLIFGNFECAVCGDDKNHNGVFMPDREGKRHFLCDPCRGEHYGAIGHDDKDAELLALALSPRQ